MPLTWKRGRNPYVHNAFGALQIGPATPPLRLHALAEKRKPKPNAAAGDDADARAAAHAVDEAQKCLRDPAQRAEEQLLAHPQTHADGDKRRRLGTEIRKAAQVPESPPALVLRSAAALYWFTPLPAAACVGLPAWESLGL